MSLLSSFRHPVTIAFFVMAIGLCIGKIKVRHISLDSAAVLLAAVAVGYLFSVTDMIADINQMNAYMKMFSALGTSLFVSVVGLTAGYALHGKTKGKLLSTTVGMLMVASSFAAMRIVSQLHIGISDSDLLGVLCGALTSSPGLSAVCEKASVVPEEAALGYGSAYLFGVIITVLTVQIITRKDQPKAENGNSTEVQSKNRALFGGLVQIGAVIVFGRLLGALTVPYIDFSLGNAGGILCAGVVIGYLINRFSNDRCMGKEQKSIVRNLGLVLFFAGNGVSAGFQLKNHFSVIPMIVGIILSVTPIAVGWFLCRIILRKSNTETAAVISGGMTSTPAIGVLAPKEGIPYDQYSFAYAGALMMIVLLL